MYVLSKKSMLKLVLLLVAMLGFFGCGDKEEQNSQKPSQALMLKVYSQDELVSMLGLMPNEERYFIMRGEIGGEPNIAYVLVGKSPVNPHEYIITLTLPDYFDEQYAINDFVILPLSKVELGLDSGAFVIKGKWEIGEDSGLNNSKMKDKDFAFKQNTLLPISEIDLLTGAFQGAQKDDRGEDLSYTHHITQAFIPQNTPAQNALAQTTRDRLNLALNGGAKDKQTLTQNLNTQTKSGFEKLIQDGGGLLFHTEYSQNIQPIYVDKDFIIFRELDFVFEGGAHGNTIYTTHAFRLDNGEELSHTLDFQKQETLLAMLSKKLEGKKELLFSESLPLQTLPDIFSFNSSGVILQWSPYSIAPYSSGVIALHIPFKQMKEFLGANSPYAPLFNRN